MEKAQKKLKALACIIYICNSRDIEIPITCINGDFDEVTHIVKWKFIKRSKLIAVTDKNRIINSHWKLIKKVLYTFTALIDPGKSTWN